MRNVIELPVITRLDSPADSVLENNMGALNDVVLIGYDKDGEFFFASNKADGAEVLWLLEKAKQELLNV